MSTRMLDQHFLRVNDILVVILVVSPLFLLYYSIAWTVGFVKSFFTPQLLGNDQPTSKPEHLPAYSKHDTDPHGSHA